MRSLVILILGCLPLSVLTVWSFVELGSVRDRIARAEGPRDFGQEQELAEQAALQADRAQPLLDELAEVDLLSGEPIPGLEVVSEENVFEPVKDAWPKWTGARRMVADFLEVERTAATASDPLDQIPLEELQGADQRLQESIRTYEESRQKYEKLKQAHQSSPARGAGPFLALLDRRITRLDRLIAQCQRQRDAAELWGKARAAFDQDEEAAYGECADLCGELLGKHRPVLHPSVLAEVTVLRQRARFRGDAARLAAVLQDADTPAQHEALEAFVTDYGDDRDGTSWTAAEQRIYDRYQLRLGEVKGQLDLERANRAAADRIQDLHQNLPRGFNDRLERALEILESHPTEKVRTELRALVGQWLQEFLPEKPIRESPRLQEAETTKHEIVQGYFAEVIAPDGTLFGYKRYPTYEQFLKPVFDVGTYRKHEFLAPPGASVPRRCAAEYQEARDRLLEDPGRREAWAALGALCDSLQARLGEYRDKTGAGRDDLDLSFVEEGQFVRELLSGPHWAEMQALFPP